MNLQLPHNLLKGKYIKHTSPSMQNRGGTHFQQWTKAEVLDLLSTSQLMLMPIHCLPRLYTEPTQQT